MKKTLIAVFFFILPFSVSASTFSVTPNPATQTQVNNGDVLATCSGCSSTDYWILFAVDETGGAGSINMGGDGDSIPDGTYFSEARTYTAVNFNDELYGVTGTYTLADIQASPYYIGSYSFVVTGAAAPSGLGTQITNASESFTAAIGLSWSDAALYMKGIMLLVLGSGLGVLVSLLPYIIALVVIAAMAYFSYRGFTIGLRGE